MAEIEGRLARVDDALAKQLRASMEINAKLRVEIDRLWQCSGCGTRKSLEQIRAETPGAMSCCPERKMEPK